MRAAVGFLLSIAGLVAITSSAASASPRVPPRVVLAPTNFAVFGEYLQGPSGMVDVSGRLFVANSYSNTITVLNDVTHSVLRRITGGSLNDPVAMATDGTDIWVLNEAVDSNNETSGSESVTELGVASMTVVASITGSKYGFNVASCFEDIGLNDIAIANGDVWVTNECSNTVTQIDKANGALVRIVSGASYGFSDPTAIAADGANMLVTNATSSTITEFSATSGAFEKLLSGSALGLNEPVDVIVDGTSAWVLNVAGSLSEIDLSSDGLVMNVSGAAYGLNAPVSMLEVSGSIWVVDTDLNSNSDLIPGLTELDASSGALQKVLVEPSSGNSSVELYCAGQLAAGAGTLFVSGSFCRNAGASLSVVTTVSLTSATMAYFPASAFDFLQPDAIAPDGKNLWVVNDGTNYLGAYLNIPEKIDATDGSVLAAETGSNTEFYTLANDSPYISIDRGSAWELDPYTNTIDQLSEGNAAFLGAEPESAHDLFSPAGIAASSGRLWLLDSSGWVVEESENTGADLHIFRGSEFHFASPDGIAADGGQVWVANGATNTITTFNAADPRVAKILTAKSDALNGPGSMAVGAGELWVLNFANGDDYVSVINESTGSLLETIDLPKSLFADNNYECVTGLAIADGRLWTADPCLNYIAGVSLDQLALAPSLASMSVGSGPSDGGEWLTLTGSHLDQVQSVNFGSAVVSPFAPGCSPTRCTILAPSHAAGTVSISLTDLTGSTIGTPLRFTFGSPSLSVSPSSAAFSAVVSTPSSPAWVTVRNTGSTYLPLDGVAFSGTDFGIVNQTGSLAPNDNACQGVVLSPGSTCSFGIVLYSNTLAASMKASLDVFDGHGKQVGQIALEGTTSPPRIDSVTPLHVAPVGSLAYSPELVVLGAGFGTAFPTKDIGVPSSTGDITIADTTRMWIAGQGSSCSLTVQAWSNSAIILGLGLDATACPLRSGDQIVVDVTNTAASSFTTSQVTVQPSDAGPTPVVASIAPDFATANPAPGSTGSRVVISGSALGDTLAVIVGSKATTDFTAGAGGSSLILPNGVPNSSVAEGEPVLVVTKGGEASSLTGCSLLLRWWNHCASSFFYMQHVYESKSLNGEMSVEFDAGPDGVGGSIDISSGGVTLSGGAELGDVDNSQEDSSQASDSASCVVPQVGGNIQLAVKGSIDATESGNYEVSTNDFVPSSFFGTTTLAIKSITFGVSAGGALSGSVLIPILGAPCGVALYLKVDGEIDGSMSFTLHIKNLVIQAGGGFLNGSVEPSSSIGAGADYIHCDGASLTAANASNCVSFTNEVGISGSLSISPWIQAGGSVAYIGAGPEFQLTDDNGTLGGTMDLMAEGGLAVSVPFVGPKDASIHFSFGKWPL